MNEVHALIQGKLSPQSMDIQQLMSWAEAYPDPQSREYQLLDLALNMVLATYLEKAHKHV
jgi:hypothetical protein